MDNTTKLKEAFKMSLAMVIAYYIGLWVAWMNPTWAAIAVGMISQPTTGQSINKGILRMGGTLLTFAAGLFYLGIFPQERWWFFISFSPFLGYVTYKMTGKNGQYFLVCYRFCKHDDGRRAKTLFWSK